MYAETVAGRPSRYAGCGRELANGYDAVVEYFERLHAESVAIFSQLSDQDLASKCRTPADADITTWKWLRAMCEHEAHHRGQLYLMLNLLEVPTPPLYGSLRKRSAQGQPDVGTTGGMPTTSARSR
jgi:uncharacterized damage-inducible protein DinB